MDLKNFLRAAREEIEDFDLLIEAEVPAFRSFDVKRSVDLIEEILRIKGYTEVEPKPPLFEARAGETEDPEARIRGVLSSRGFFEDVTFPWIEEELLEVFNLKGEWEVINPLSSDQRFLRTSMVPSLVKVLSFNESHFNRDVSIFELGRVYLKGQEPPRLGLLASGAINRHFRGQREWDFLTFKGALEALFKKLGVEEFRFEAGAEDFLHPYLSARIEAGGEGLGYLGRLHPTIAKKLELKSEPFVAEVDLDALLRVRKRALHRPLSKFPPVKRDFAFVLERDRHRADALLEAAREVFGELLEEFFIFDLYEGKELGEDRVSVALRVRLRHPQRSLSDEEVNELAERFIKKLEGMGIRLR